MGWREDDARWEAEDEARRDAEWERHYAEHDAPGAESADCWICVERAEEAAAEAV